MQKFKTFLEQNSLFFPVFNKNGFPDPTELTMKRETWKPTSKQIDMMGKAFTKNDESINNFYGSFRSNRAQDLLGKRDELIKWVDAMSNSDRKKVLDAYNKYRNQSKKLADHFGVAVGRLGTLNELPDDPSDAFA